MKGLPPNSGSVTVGIPYDRPLLLLFYMISLSLSLALTASIDSLYEFKSMSQCFPFSQDMVTFL